jgi:hypothetical protein
MKGDRTRSALPVIVGCADQELPYSFTYSLGVGQGLAQLRALSRCVVRTFAVLRVVRQSDCAD